MNYVLSHLPVLIFGAGFVAVCAVLWWYLLDKNERLKKKRAEARMAEAAAKRIELKKRNTDE